MKGTWEWLRPREAMGRAEIGKGPGQGSGFLGTIGGGFGVGEGRRFVGRRPL